MAKKDKGGKGKGDGKGKGKGGDAKPEPTAVPDFHDEDEVLRVLKRSDFPTSMEGRLAHFDYRMEKLKAEKERFAQRNDPKAKVKRKMEKYKKLIAELEDELGDD